jgi:hypothetical protein
MPVFKNKKILLAAFMCSVMSVPVAVSAQEGTTVIYDQAYFKQYSPVTLSDMFNNIPGGSKILGDIRRASYMGGRGFGSAGAPILINGRRMSGKANDMSTQLARTQASQVERIELIRGNAEGLDIQSEGTLYNVIMKAGSENSSSSFVDVRVNYVGETNPTPELLLSHTRKAGDVEFSLSYQYDTGPRMWKIYEDVFNADGSQREYRPAIKTESDTTHKVTGNVAFDLIDVGRFRLNGLFSDRKSNKDTLEDRYLVDAGGTQTFYALDDVHFGAHDKSWEIGGDFEGKIGNLGTLKSLFIISDDYFDDIFTQDLTENGVTDRYFFGDPIDKINEKIFRASMTSQLADKHSLEYGGEAAYNKLDNTNQFNDDAPENSIVKEDRYEVFATHNFAFAEGWNLQSGLTGEFSKVGQNRDGVTNSRKFSYLKPRFELRYDLSDTDQIRLLAERKVSQLRMSGFVASRNVDDETINFGNPDLVPDRTWEYRAGYEHRFKDDAGTLEVELFYDRISDLIDRIGDGDGGSGTGNIGKGEKYGVDVNASVRFGFIGVPNAVFSANYKYTGSKVMDPFTGEERILRYTTPHYWDVKFQHDVTEYDFTYGFSAHRRSVMRRTDINVQETADFQIHVFAFMEYKLSDNMRLRFDAKHLSSDTKYSNRTYYLGNIMDGNVDRVDDIITNANPDFVLRLQATF